MKFCKLALISAAFISSGAFAAATVTSDVMDVVASVTVAAPVNITASWEPSSNTFVAGDAVSGTVVGRVSINGGASTDGALVYSDSNANYEDNDVTFTFRGPNSAELKTTVHASNNGIATPMVSISTIEGATVAPGVKLPAGDKTATFALKGDQALVAGTYTANISMVTYTD